MIKRKIYTRIVGWIISDDKVGKYRRELVGGARGKILEIGIGTGANLKYYPPGVNKVWAIDKNNMLRKNDVFVEFCEGVAEELPFPDGEFDFVVSSFTLCSVNNVNKVLGEIKRVLKRGGSFLFLEHVVSKDEKIRKKQKRYKKVFLVLGDGCHIDRDIVAEVKKVFSKVDVREFQTGLIPMAVSEWCMGKAKRG